MTARAPSKRSARRYDPSRDRQTLYRLLSELRKLLDSFCDSRVLVRGKLQTLRRRCGKARCRCTRGSLHESSVFIDRSAGSRIIRTVSAAQRSLLKQPTECYISLRRHRAQISALHHEILATCDRLSSHCLEEGKGLLARLKA